MHVVMAMFPLKAHSNIIKNFSLIESALVKFRITDQSIKLVAYATIRAETGDCAPKSEGESRFNTLKIPPELTPHGEAGKYNLYELRNKTTRVLGQKVSGLGNDQLGDGEKYIGRGFVQLTGKANYLKYGQQIGLGSNLVDNPSLANDPGIAAQVLAAYIRENLRFISPAVRVGNLRMARKAVNGGLNGMAEFERAYSIGSKLLRAGVADPRSIA
jgi:putative chitinase